MTLQPYGVNSTDDQQRLWLWLCYCDDEPRLTIAWEFIELCWYTATRSHLRADLRQLVKQGRVTRSADGVYRGVR